MNYRLLLCFALPTLLALGCRSATGPAGETLTLHGVIHAQVGLGPQGCTWPRFVTDRGGSYALVSDDERVRDFLRSESSLDHGVTLTGFVDRAQCEPVGSQERALNVTSYRLDTGP
jgi:hypothetical protein